MKGKKEKLLLKYYFLSFSNGLNQNPANMYKILKPNKADLGQN